MAIADGKPRSNLTTIRPFQNADVPGLLEAWIEHWASFGPAPQLSVAKFEQAVLARRSFRQSEMRVAIQNDQVVGWASIAASATDETVAVLYALCFAPGPDQTGDQLLTAMQQAAKDAGFQKLQVGVVRDQSFGLAGLDPIGHGVAVPQTDAATGRVLAAAGFAEQAELVRMAASTHGYRPPISRESMQLRRTSQVRTDNHFFDDARQASAMAHLDVETNRLFDRGGNQLANLDFWYSDPEAEVMNPTVAIVDLGEAYRRGRLETAELYLLGTILQSMEQRRVLVAETAIESDRAELINQLQSLRFQILYAGNRWEKQIT